SAASCSSARASASASPSTRRATSASAPVCGSVSDVIVFASDFGHADGYVGIVESVIATIAPSERVVHLAHDIAPQDVRAASLVLWSAARHLPAGTIVLAVIDPGVGGSRRAIAARGRKLVAIGPDNGLFGALWSIDPPHQVCLLSRD